MDINASKIAMNGSFAAAATVGLAMVAVGVLTLTRENVPQIAYLLPLLLLFISTIILYFSEGK
mgnify:CR=1 FL=1